MAVAISVSILFLAGFGLWMYGYHGLTNNVKTFGMIIPYFGGILLLAVGIVVLLSALFL